jgi:DNA-binding NtrC family response regulator
MRRHHSNGRAASTGLRACGFALLHARLDRRRAAQLRNPALGGGVVDCDMAERSVRSDETLSITDAGGERRVGRDLVVVIYHRDGAEIAPLGPRGVVVGREAPSDLVVPEPTLSRRHARFYVDGADVLVEDLGSRNGVAVGGERVERAKVPVGIDVGLGSTVARIEHRARRGELASGLETFDGLQVGIEREIVRARFFGETVALALLRPLERGVQVRHFLMRARALLRPIDRAALYSDDTLALLLPRVSAKQLGKLGEQLAEPIRNESRLACGLALCPDSATNAEELVAAALGALRSTTSGAPVAVARTGVDAERGAPVGAGGAMKELLAAVERVARSAAPVLLLGETGSGKEVVARALHERSGRRGRLVAVNCGAIPPQLVESTLFGHEKGAFSGADQRNKGVFEAADGGTVLLDEIGELPRAAQAALLRVLEEKRVVRVGSTEEIVVDVRVLAATHRDLEAMTAKQEFRRDLLYRLQVVELCVPPLREHREDIPRLTARFLEDAARSEGRAFSGLTDDAAAVLLQYDWPGNVRELRNVIERAAAIATTDWIDVEHLPERVRRKAARAPANAPATDDWPSLEAHLDVCERQHLIDTLRATGENQTRAAELLKISRRTLLNKLQHHGIRRGGHTVVDQTPEDG